MEGYLEFGGLGRVEVEGIFGSIIELIEVTTGFWFLRRRSDFVRLEKDFRRFDLEEVIELLLNVFWSCFVVGLLFRVFFICGFGNVVIS